MSPNEPYGSAFDFTSTLCHTPRADTRHRTLQPRKATVFPSLLLSVPTS